MRFKESHIDEFIGLILYIIAKHHSTPTISRYDMIQSGYIGLAQALKTYDKTKGVPLKCWVYRIINSTIIKLVYKNSKERKEYSGLDDVIKAKIESSTIVNPLESIYITEDNNIKDAQVKSIMIILNNNANNHPNFLKDNGINKILFVEHIIKNTKIKELSIKYNMSYSQISHRIQKISKIIKGELCK